MVDEAALQLLQDYSKACARFAHEPSQQNAFAMDTKRDAMALHFKQREHGISAAIDRVVLAATIVGRTFVSTGEWDEAQQTLKQREAELRTAIGLS